MIFCRGDSRRPPLLLQFHRLHGKCLALNVVCALQSFPGSGPAPLQILHGISEGGDQATEAQTNNHTQGNDQVTLWFNRYIRLLDRTVKLIDTHITLCRNQPLVKLLPALHFPEFENERVFTFTLLQIGNLGANALLPRM